jgi:hypothetical protein
MKNKNMLFFIAIIGGITIVTGGLILSNQFNDSIEVFGIYLMEDEVVVSGDDIISYNKTSHEIKLNQEGIDRIKKLELIQKPFEVKLGSRVIYSGSFWSAILSSTSSSAVIIDILLIQGGLTDTIRIDPCYPILLCESEDPRNNTEIFDYFQRAAKLIQ